MQNKVLSGMLQKGYTLVDTNHIKSQRGIVYFVNVYLYGTDLVLDVKNMNNNKVSASQKIVKDLINVCISLGYEVPKCRNTKYDTHYMIPQTYLKGEMCNEKKING